MSESTTKNGTKDVAGNGATDPAFEACPLPPPASEMAQYQDPRVIQRILHSGRTVAIVGLSADSLRPSNFVGFYLQRHGYRIVPVNPKEREVLGETSYPSLSAIPFPVDIVDVFRRPQFVPAIAEEAVKIGAKALWLQFNVISPEGARIAKQGGLDVVMDKCIKVEHARYMGKMHWFGLNTGVISSQRE
jgi:predicted CoA-binding protein